MTDDREIGYDHEDRSSKIEAAARLLKDTLIKQGLAVALSADKSQPDSLGLDYLDLMRLALDLMRLAIVPLLDSEDTDRQNLGLEFLAWEAKHSPNSEVADTIIEYVKTRPYESGSPQYEFKGKCFEVALMHFRCLVRDNNFTLATLYDFNEVIYGIGSEGYYELHTNATTEFALPVIELAESCKQEPIIEGEGTDYKKDSIDEALFRIVEILEESDTETATRATELITSDKLKKEIADRKAIKELAVAMLAGEFDKAKRIMATLDRIEDLSSGEDIWELIAGQFKKPEGTDLWGNTILDTILEVHPNYFSQLAEGGSFDIFLGDNFGLVIGWLDLWICYLAQMKRNPET